MGVQVSKNVILLNCRLPPNPFIFRLVLIVRNLNKQSFAPWRVLKKQLQGVDGLLVQFWFRLDEDVENEFTLAGLFVAYLQYWFNFRTPAWWVNWKATTNIWLSCLSHVRPLAEWQWAYVNGNFLMSTSLVIVSSPSKVKVVKSYKFAFFFSLFFACNLVFCLGKRLVSRQFSNCLGSIPQLPNCCSLRLVVCVSGIPYVHSNVCR